MSRFWASLMLLLVTAIWGLTFVVQKWAATGAGALGPFTFNGLRFLLGAAVVLPLALAERRRIGRPAPARQWAGFAFCGAALLAGSWMQQVGVATTSVGNAGFINSAYVALVPALAWGLFGRRPHWMTWPSIGLCLAGVWTLTGGLGRLSSGDLWVLGSSVFWALQITVVGVIRGARERPLTLACVQFAVTGVVATALALLLEHPSLALIRGGAGELLWGGAISVGIAFTLQVVAQQHLHPATAALIMSMEMVFAAIGGILAFGEALGAAQLGGAAMILASVLAVELVPMWLASRREPDAHPCPAQAE